jgi:hypothetical protein
MNILCMGGRTVGPEVAWDLVQTLLAAQFSHGNLPEGKQLTAATAATPSFDNRGTAGKRRFDRVAWVRISLAPAGCRMDSRAEQLSFHFAAHWGTLHCP